MNIESTPSVYQNTRCIFTAANFEAAQSQKRRPQAPFRSKEFIHRVDILTPEDWSPLPERLHAPTQYYKIKAKLDQLFEKNFFQEHVKTGNISMISEGSPIYGNTFSICRGKFKLYLDKETYERSGLSGKPDERNGTRETQPKWFVSYDLQSPSMVHGKRGFDRLVYGCRSISDTPMKWVCTLEDSSTTISQLSCGKVSAKLTTSQIKTHQVITQSMPSFQDGLEADTAADLYEWLSLVRLGSPRVLHNDTIDPYLSRYIVPDSAPGETSVSRTSWDGVFSSSWVSNLVSTLFAACPEDSWLVISATDMPAGGLGGKSEITVLKPPGQSSRYLMWDIKHS
ncbi:hypothetical protein PWT90_00184 [Aphanocladium album]|nr:hypothetical protein PWT90_00184 [Aphanocladium album]